MRWLCSRLVDFTAEEYGKAYEALTPGRKARIDRYRRQEDRMRSLAGEILAKRLAREMGDEAPVVENMPSGQPVLRSSHLHLSIAHSADRVACAVSLQPVGIDIEQVRPFRAGMLRHVCTEEEREFVLQGQESQGEITDPRILDRFFEIWTGKEAWFKKAGTGIQNLQSVQVLSLPREVHRVEDYIIQIM